MPSPAIPCAICVGSLRVSTFNLIIYSSHRGKGRGRGGGRDTFSTCHLPPTTGYLPLAARTDFSTFSYNLPLPKICFAFKWHFLFNLFATLLSAYFNCQTVCVCHCVFVCVCKVSVLSSVLACHSISIISTASASTFQLIKCQTICACWNFDFCSLSQHTQCTHKTHTHTTLSLTHTHTPKWQRHWSLG